MYPVQPKEWYCKGVLTCNAILSQAVHLSCADVQLQGEQRLALRGCAKGQNCGMQTLQCIGQA